MREVIHPRNSRPLEELIAELERDPEMKDAMDKARVEFKEWLNNGKQTSPDRDEATNT